MEDDGFKEEQNRQLAEIREKCKKEIERKIKKLFKYLEESYGSIANVRLYSKGMSLQPIIEEAVYHLFGKK